MLPARSLRKLTVFRALSRLRRPSSRLQGEDNDHGRACQRCDISIFRLRNKLFLNKIPTPGTKGFGKLAVEIPVQCRVGDRDWALGKLQLKNSQQPTGYRGKGGVP